MNFPTSLKYTKDHEWVRIEGEVVYTGITEFAQSELGDIVYLDINTVGQEVKSGDIFGTVEAVKTVSDLFLPLTGKILEVNSKLESEPELINSDPYGDGWMIKSTITNSAEIEELLSADDYKKLIGK